MQKINPPMQKPGFKKSTARVPLFWKFTVGLTVMVILFGTVNILLINRIVYTSLDEELQQRGMSISRMISYRAVDYLLYDDRVALNRLVDEIIIADPSIEYIIILNRYNEIFAHTFEGMVPSDLLSINSTDNTKITTSHIMPKGSRNLIRDIAIPLFDGKVGTVRVGMTEENISRTLNQAGTTMIGMVAAFFIIGLLGIFGFSYMVTHPVQSIGRIAEGIDFASIKDKQINFAVRYPKPLDRAMSHLPMDELDTLVERFNEMVFRLENAYDKLEHAQKNLVQSEKLASIGTLASGVAHEVNNPLAGMMHCIERMLHKPDDKESNRQLLLLMQDAAQKVDKVVNNLLNFARQSDHVHENVKITDILSNALLLASHKLEKHRITIDQKHQDEDIMVKGNKNQLEQVMLNLVLNSVDAISEKLKEDNYFQGKITFLSQIEGTSACIYVQDNGAGISDENLTKVIDPFYTTKTVGKGTGLGLSISLNIMKEHNGELEISSLVNKGTSIKLSLPLHELQHIKQV
jgi:two-component system, NtrC family, sensor kinase